MEPPLYSSSTTEPKNPKSESSISAPSLLQQNPLVSPEAPIESLKKNIYPTMRHLLLVALVFLTFLFIVFLILQNGKSIYDHGL